MSFIATKKSLGAEFHQKDGSIMGDEKDIIEFLNDTKKNESNNTLLSLLFSNEEVDIKQEKYIRPIEKIEIPLTVSVTAFKEQNEDCIHKVCVIHDQSLYEELEASRKDAVYQKGLFAMINHELRNPLHGILGIFEIIMQYKIVENVRQQCRIGLNTGQLMLLMVNDILDISQLEACKFKLSEELFPVSETLEECVEIMKYRFEQKSIALFCKVKGNILIMNDKNRYKQVIINLLSNSLKFTNKGFVKITCWQDPTTKRLFTKVKDTGEGIKPEEQSKIFSMYCKLKHQQTANPTGKNLFNIVFLGCGLGLTICKKLCEAMSGSISFTSVYGAGTKFIFDIKDLELLKNTRTNKNNFQIPEEEKLTTVQLTCEALKPEYRILVVDDDIVCGHIVASYCKSIGINAEVVIIKPLKTYLGNFWL